MVENVYFHIGYPKTATTFLQKSIYPCLKNVHYTPILTEQRHEKEIFKILFQELSNLDCQEINKVLLANNTEKKILYSQEIFSTGSIGTRFLDLRSKIKVLKNIKQIFPQQQVKVIVGIREQTDIIRSFYLQYLHKGGTKNLEAFLNHFGFSKIHSKLSSFFDSFQYSPYINEVMNTFGSDNVYIYIYENLRIDPGHFMEDLFNFFGEKELPQLKISARNKGYGELAVIVARILNKFFKMDQNSTGLFPVLFIPKVGELSPRRILQSKYFRLISNKDYRIPAKISAQLKKIYLDDNIELRDKYKLKLPYHYFH